MLIAQVAWDDINGKLPHRRPEKPPSQARQDNEDEEWEVEEDTTSEKEVIEAVSELKVEDPKDSRGLPPASLPEFEDEIL